MNGKALRCSAQVFLCRSGVQRAAKFALVGAVGIAVQLGALELLTALGLHYLWATGLSVEAAVLHNFIWHQRFTWSDRGSSRSQDTALRLFRFHLSNGAISILGSLLLMRWFVGQFGMSVLVGNLLTIAACSAGNFLAGDRWVFLSPVHLHVNSSHGESEVIERSPIRSSVRCAKGT
jgi:dolichol-phosphate mannosyltransferase